MDLLQRRAVGAMRIVRAVIQIVGHSAIPVTPRNSDELTDWYRKHSFVVIPSTHRVLGPAMKAKDIRRHGDLVPIDESQPVKLIMRALPGIEQFVSQKLAQYTLD